MSHSAFRLPRFITLAAALVLPLMLDSCSSSKKKLKGVPANLPVIPIQGAAATPPHSMSHREYPFDSGGNYVSAWAAEGERSAGRGSAASTDYAEWKSSHIGESRPATSKEKKTASTAKKKKPSREPERTPLSPPIKITSTAPKKTSGTTSKKTPSVAATASKGTSKKSAAAPAKKSSAGGSYKVKKGDTLYSIARKSGTTVAKIKAANGLKSDIIRDGQSLKIP